MLHFFYAALALCVEWVIEIEISNARGFSVELLLLRPHFICK